MYYIQDSKNDEKIRDIHYNQLELVVLSRLYSLYDAATPDGGMQDCNWHVVVGAIHQKPESHMNTTLTSHSKTFGNYKKQKEKGSIYVPRHKNDDSGLNFYTNIVAEFKVGKTAKMLNIVIYNQNADNTSVMSSVFTLEALRWKNLKHLFSIGAIQSVMFFMLTGMMMFGHKACKSTNESCSTRVDEFIMKNYGSQDQAKEDGFKRTNIMTWPEYFCYNEDTLMGQFAVVFIFLTVVKHFVFKAGRQQNRPMVPAPQKPSSLDIQTKKN